MSLTMMNRPVRSQQFGQVRGGSMQLVNGGGSISRGMMATQGVRGGQYQCINPGNPFGDVEVGMPNDLIPSGVCLRMGIPEGSTWGHNAAEIRQLQQGAGMNFGGMETSVVQQPSSGRNSARASPAQRPVDAQGEITSTGMLGVQI